MLYQRTLTNGLAYWVDTWIVGGTPSLASYPGRGDRAELTTNDPSAQRLLDMTSWEFRVTNGSSTLVTNFEASSLDIAAGVTLRIFPQAFFLGPEVTDNRGTIIVGGISEGLTVSPTFWIGFGPILDGGGFEISPAVGGTTTLDGHGTGKLLLGYQNSSGVTLRGQQPGNTLVNLNHTIEGSGDITGLKLWNTAGGVVRTVGGNLAVTPSAGAEGIRNQGLMEARGEGGSGTLAVSGDIVQRDAGGANAGVILADGGSISFQGATLHGGTLRAANLGTIAFSAGSAIEGLTSAVEIEGVMVAASELTASGTATGKVLAADPNGQLGGLAVGTLLVGAGGFGTNNLRIDSAAKAAPGVSDATLTNVGALSLAGKIGEGDARLQLHNKGALTPLEPNPGDPAPEVHTGRAVINDGVITADAGSRSFGGLTVRDAITGSGWLEAAAGGLLRLDGATTQTVTLRDGWLSVDRPFAGTVAGFGGEAAILLQYLPDAAGASLRWSQTRSTGELTVSRNGMSDAQLKFAWDAPQPGGGLSLGNFLLQNAGDGAPRLSWKPAVDLLRDSPTDALKPAGSTLMGGSVTGWIDGPEDRDLFAVDLVAGKSYVFELKGWDGNAGTLAKPALALVHPDLTTYAFGGNIAGTNDMRFAAKKVAASGTYLLDVSTVDGLGTGSYTLTAKPLPSQLTVTRNFVAVQEDATPYEGPVAYLDLQYLGSLLGEVVGGSEFNDFMNMLGGDDAGDGGTGEDVLDGGTGSNFLAGGGQRDVFFLDGRGGSVTWSTITDWAPGEQLSVWGWKPGVSRTLWLDNDGAEGWKGVTLHMDLDGDGTIDTSVTWTGRSAADLPKPLEFAAEQLLWFT